MKRNIIIIIVGLLSFAFGWWTHSVKKQNTEGLKTGAYDQNTTTTNISVTDTSTSERDFSKQQLQTALHDSTSKQVLVDTVIADKETAIRVAESILFKIYEEDNIKAERPYRVDFVDGYWILNGTLSPERLGGTFCIILNAANGQVIALTHDK